MYRENETTELKEKVVTDIRKEIVAFANCNGGQIYIGVRDDGSVAGLEDPDQAALQVSNMVRDAIKPDLTMFLHYETIEEDGAMILRIDIQRGTDRPYYIAKKGLRPEGVYVRQGYSSVPASDTAIRNMIKETDGDRFEAMRSLEQNLTFDDVGEEFRKRNVEFGIPQMKTLNISGEDGLYTNLGLLLSDQCPHTIKAAVFQGTDQSVFKTRHEFEGSLMRQLNEVYDYIDRYNQIHADFEGLLRIDTRDYPETAVREALLNLLVHRDYSFHASAFIRIYDDRMEFVSLGGLLPGIGVDDIMMGVSVCRNQNLANVFYRLRLIEAYGTGIQKIMQAYAKVDKKPVLEVTGNTFKITLPNCNFRQSQEQTEDKALDLYQDEREKQVLQMVKDAGSVTRAEVESRLEISTSTATRLLRRMVKYQMLKPYGRGRTTRYTLARGSR